MKKILITISGLHFHKDEGAKNRLNSFIDSYDNKEYDVEVLLFYSLSSFKYIFNRQKYLKSNAKWHLYPSLPIGINPILTRFSNFISQLIFGVFVRTKKFQFIQSEIRGNICKYKRPNDYLIVDFHGDSISENLFNGKNEKFIRYLKKEQKESLRFANFIIGVSDKLIKQLQINTDEIINHFGIVSCGVNVSRFTGENKSELFESEKDRLIIGYLGGLQEWQSISSILEIVKSLQKINSLIYFVLYTNDNTEKYSAQLKQLGQSNYFVKSLSYQEVPQYISILDAGFLIRENNTLNIVSSPTKTAEYLAAGVPVICTRYSGDYEKSINHSKEGFVLNEISATKNEIEELNKYLLTIKKDRDQFKKDCILSASKRTWDIEFNSFYNKLILLKVY